MGVPVAKKKRKKGGPHSALLLFCLSMMELGRSELYLAFPVINVINVKNPFYSVFLLGYTR